MERDQRRGHQRRGFGANGSVVRLWLLCAVLGGLTVLQCRVWQSNLTLWTHAVSVSPSLARPAINLAVAYRITGRPGHAVRWLLIAGPLTEIDPRGDDYRRVIAREYALLDSFGTITCDHPAARPYC